MSDESSPERAIGLAPGKRFFLFVNGHGIGEVTGMKVFDIGEVTDASGQVFDAARFDFELTEEWGERFRERMHR